jgi:spore germination cell wall hydrolase CwlJ-like protein
MIALSLPSLPSAQPVLAWLRAYPREAFGSALLASAALSGAVALADPAASLPRMLDSEERALAEAPTPPVEPMLMRNIAPGTAEALNAAVPVASGPNPAARPFQPAALKGVAYVRARECLTQAIYYEAATESLDGQQAVAQVVLNRVRHPAYPASVCGVVYQGHERRTGCQFTFTCDGALARAPMRSYWDRARKVAEAALAGYVYAPVGNATHYHTDWVVPYWASSLVKSAVIGSHIFYRWAGGWGRPAAFGQRYSGVEADAAALRTQSLAAEAADRALAAGTPPPAAATLAGGALGVVELKPEASIEEEFPPEFLRLLGADPGSKKDQRVTLRVASPRGEEAATGAVGEKQPDRPLGSTSLRWGLTGGNGDSAEQKPLGKSSAAPAEPPPGPRPTVVAPGQR